MHLTIHPEARKSCTRVALILAIATLIEYLMK